MLVEAAAALSSHCRTPFPSGLSISSDGQILVLTHSNLHILTPALGLSLRTDRSALSGYPGNKAQDQWTADKLNELFGEGECKGLHLFKNGIEIQKREIDWEDWTNDVRNTVPGGLDNGWRMASWSPSGLNELGGCVLAAMNVNREVHVYAPDKDPIKATWIQTFDLTATYLDILLCADPELAKTDTKQSYISQGLRRRKEALVQRVQTSSISWSPATPAHAVKDESLLAISHRSGHLTLWRYSERGLMSLVSTETPTDNGAVIMAWTDWNSRLDSDSGQIVYSTQLALGCASESIKILRISIQPDSQITIEPMNSILKSHKTVTALKWLKMGQLAVGRLGEVVVWTTTETMTFTLPIEDFRGWPSVSSPIDILHISATDRLVIAMSDGTYRVISALSKGPTVDTLQKGGSASADLSEQIRRGFLAVERATLKKGSAISGNSAMLLSGCLGLDSSGTFISGYERHSLDTKVFNMANQHRSAVMLGRLFNDDDVGTSAIQDIKMLLAEPEPGFTTSSSRALFPIFLSLRHFPDKEDVARQLLDCLSLSLDLSHKPPEWLMSKDDYATFLLGDRKLQAIRLGAQIAKHCIDHVPLGNLQYEVEQLLEKIARHLYLLTFGAMLRTLDFGGTVSNSLYIRFQQVIQSVQEPTPEYGNMDVDGMNTVKSADVFGAELDDLDRCAACSEVIGFDRLGRATCRNGHEWLRCSITLAVLSTAAARTCTVCSRKSRVPVALTYEVDEMETASQALLHMAKYCLFCGGRWTRGH